MSTQDLNLSSPANVFAPPLQNSSNNPPIAATTDANNNHSHDGTSQDQTHDTNNDDDNNNTSQNTSTEDSATFTTPVGVVHRRSSSVRDKAAAFDRLAQLERDLVTGARRPSSSSGGVSSPLPDHNAVLADTMEQDGIDGDEYRRSHGWHDVRSNSRARDSLPDFARAGGGVFETPTAARQGAIADKDRERRASVPVHVMAQTTSGAGGGGGGGHAAQRRELTVIDRMMLQEGQAPESANMDNAGEEEDGPNGHHADAHAHEVEHPPPLPMPSSPPQLSTVAPFEEPPAENGADVEQLPHVTTDKNKRTGIGLVATFGTSTLVHKTPPPDFSLNTGGAMRPPRPQHAAHDSISWSMSSPGSSPPTSPSSSPLDAQRQSPMLGKASPTKRPAGDEVLAHKSPPQTIPETGQSSPPVVAMNTQISNQEPPNMPVDADTSPQRPNNNRNQGEDDNDDGFMPGFSDDNPQQRKDAAVAVDDGLVETTHESTSGKSSHTDVLHFQQHHQHAHAAHSDEEPGFFEKLWMEFGCATPRHHNHTTPRRALPPQPEEAADHNKDQDQQARATTNSES